MNISQPIKVFKEKFFHQDFLLEEIFDQDIIREIDKFHKNKIDHLFIKGLPISDNLPETPKKN